MNINVIEDDIRLDQYLSNNLEYSRSKIQKLIKGNQITVNDKIVKSSYLLSENDIIKLPDTLDTPINIIGENIPLDIVYEDEYLLIINKKSGMVVHPAPGNYTKTLVNALIYKFNLANNNIRPGIVHRLDKDTSGLMIVAKNDLMLDKISALLRERKIIRKYIALVEGVIPNDTGTIDAPIGRDQKNRLKMAVTHVNSKSAVTHFRVLKRYQNHTLIECKLDTGRTHQIRVHLNYIKHPVVNDPLYNNKKSTAFGQLLHSASIEFIHPITNHLLSFKTDLPEEFSTILNLTVQEINN